MTGLAVRETVTLAGRPERVRVARQFVGAVLGPGHPCGDAAVLLVSELYGNSVRHSGSGAPGETVTVAVMTQCHLAYFRQAAALIFPLVGAGFASFMVAGASCRVPCWPGFLTG
jgi:hypothetical protein